MEKVILGSSDFYWESENCIFKRENKKFTDYYKKNDEISLGNVSGKYSFVFQKDECLYLGSDHFSFIPLYYFVKNKCCFFSENIKDLVLELKVVSFNRNFIQTYAFERGPEHYFDLFEGETLYNEIRSVPPNSYVKIETSGEETIIKYKRDVSRNLDLKSLLFKSVNKYIIEDKLACQISGGLDSSGISSIVENSYFNDEKVDSFYVSLKAKYKEMDESFYVESFKNKYSIKKHEYTEGSGFNELNNLYRYIETYFYPPLTLSSVSWLIEQTKKVKEFGSKYMLSGEGGDQVLGNSIRYENIHWNQSEWSKYMLYLNTVNENWDLSNFFKRWNNFSEKQKIDFFIIFKIVFPFSFKNSFKYVYKLFSGIINLNLSPLNILKFFVLKFSFSKNVKNSDGLFVSNFIPKIGDVIGYSSKENLGDILYAQTHNRLLFDIINYLDKCSQLEGVQCLFPYLDEDLIDYYRFDADLEKNHNLGNKRFLYKEALFGVLPEEIKNRKDKVEFSKFNEEIGEILLKDYNALSLEINPVLWNLFNKNIITKELNNIKSGNKIGKRAQLICFIRFNILVHILEKNGIKVN